MQSNSQSHHCMRTASKTASVQERQNMFCFNVNFLVRLVCHKLNKYQYLKL